ncbi:unnamed protein product [Pseudo-nitzschia multistriata]|uniref:Uncharacterized protein n=1 Tax=Pseudo-nitzschia multistriata TaxID=183589 RepID=A0A448ZNT7_9STRA|nr:unnamed protein product [Pseudo-nitzschia multistriata]
MSYAFAASRSCNAARPTFRNAARVTGVGKRRALASINHHRLFASGDGLASQHGKGGIPGNFRSSMNFSNTSRAISFSSTGDSDTVLSKDLPNIRFLVAPQIYEEDDGG